MINIISTPTATPAHTAPHFMNCTPTTSDSKTSTSEIGYSANTTSKPDRSYNDERNSIASGSKGSSSTKGTKQLNTDAKDYVPQAKDTIVSSSSKTASKRQPHSQSVRNGTINSRLNGRTHAARIDDVNDNDNVEIAMDRPTGSRSDNSRNKGKHFDRPQQTSHPRPARGAPCSQTPNVTNDSSMARDSSRRQRGHRKDLNGRTFPSPRTPHAPETGRHQTADLNKGALRTPAKFVHKVEEDRDLKDALTIGLTNSTYDCMICWDVVRPAQRIWNCQVCWAAFHLNCLSTWATKSSEAENPWDGKPRVIKCNDYCLVAERNKRVALALNIDDSVARGPRIPRYDDYVLEYASINMEFTLKMEKRLADWVADSPSNTLNLPPMKGHHRKFVHELAAYYNVTSESMDVEPYRSVVIYKKLNTSVPDLLVSQACRQRRPIASSGPSVTVGVEQLRKSNVKDPVNAIYLHDLACGLTRNELSVQLAPIFGNIKYGIRWLTDDDAVLIPHPGNLSTNELDIVLVRLRTGIKALTSSGQLCERVELCWINKDGELVSHTSIGNGSQTKRFFNAAQANQLMKKTAPAKVENAFAILDDDERIAAAKKAEEERIMKAKEAAGTLSLEAWEENEVNSSSMDSISRKYRPPSVEDSDHSDTSSSSSSKSLSLSRSAATQKDLLNVDQHLVEDWQELLDDDNNDE
ncbi:FKBP12-associated protein [Dissophora ornata]|nr:FKBP12-associated protein [Dissophora ornata]